MFFYLGCALLVAWFGSECISKELYVDPVPEINTKEFLCEITKVSERLMSKDLELATMNFIFASQSWSAVLEWKDNTLVLTLHNENQIFLGNIFLGVGIKQSTGQGIYLWHEIKIVAPSATQASNGSWMGPSRDNLLKNKDLILSEDALTFFVRISSSPSPFCVTEEKFQALHNLSKDLKDLYFEEKDHDVRILVRDKYLGAHRTILKARSPSFTALLSQENSEIREDDCNPDDFAVFLLFLYSGTVDNLNTDNVISVYNIAHKYEVPDLMEVCARYMVSNLTAYSVSNVISVALKHKDYKLLEHATDFFLKNAEKIFPTAEWQAFLRENPIKANDLVIKSYAYQTSYI